MIELMSWEDIAMISVFIGALVVFGGFAIYMILEAK
jgi:hypothetical protein